MTEARRQIATKKGYRPRGVSIAVLDRIDQLALDGFSTPQIEDQLAKEGVDRLPERRTIQRRVKAIREADLTTAWAVGDEPDDPALILPVLSSLMETSEGRRTHVTVGEAEWIVRIRRAAPDMPLHIVYLLARAYLLRRSSGEETRDLDAFFALYARPSRYFAFVARGWVPPAPYWMVVGALVGLKPPNIYEYAKDLAEHRVDEIVPPNALSESDRQDLIRRVEEMVLKNEDVYVVGRAEGEGEFFRELAIGQLESLYLLSIGSPLSDSQAEDLMLLESVFSEDERRVIQEEAEIKHLMIYEEAARAAGISPPPLPFIPSSKGRGAPPRPPDAPEEATNESSKRRRRTLPKAE